MREIALSTKANGFGGDSVLTVYAVCFDGLTGCLGEVLDLSFDPGFVLTPKVTAATGITNAMLKGQPKYSLEHAEQILKFLRGAKVWLRSESTENLILLNTLKRTTHQSLSDVAEVFYASVVAKSMGHAKPDLDSLASYYRIDAPYIGVRDAKKSAELIAQVVVKLRQPKFKRQKSESQRKGLPNMTNQVNPENNSESPMDKLAVETKPPSAPTSVHEAAVQILKRETRPLKIPTSEDFYNFKGGHSPVIWRAVPTDWKCPCCGRSKFKLLRWTTSRKDKSNTKKWMALIERDALTNEFICQTCRSASARVKENLKIPTEFHFYPRDMRQFIQCWDHGGAKCIDEQIALHIYISRKDSLSHVPAERTPSNRPARPSRFPILSSLRKDLQRPMSPVPQKPLAFVRSASSMFNRTIHPSVTPNQESHTRSALIPTLGDLLHQANDHQLERVAAILLESQSSKVASPTVTEKSTDVRTKPANHGKPWSAVDEAFLSEEWMKEPLRSASQIGVDLERSEAAVIGKLVSLRFYADAEKARAANLLRV